MKFERQNADFDYNRLATINDIDPEYLDIEGAEVFAFPTPSALWTCNHTFGIKGLTVVTLDTDGGEVIGDVLYVDNNTVRISWDIPMAGTCRVSL